MAGAFSIAALHALIPSHWFAFAVVGRARRWPVSQTVRVAGLAGAGHVLLTIILGVIVAGLGKAIQKAIPPQLEHAATAVLLIALGLYFALPVSRRGHSHDEAGSKEHGHDCAHGDAHSAKTIVGKLGPTPTIMGTLILGMTLSPCLDLLSIYVAAAALSWATILAVSLVMAATTLSTMLVLVWMTATGLERVQLNWLEKYEGVVVGGVLILLGVYLFFRS